MKAFSEYLERIDDDEKRERVASVLDWVGTRFSKLEPIMKYNQPTFTDHDTFIISFSIAKNHLSVSPEKTVVNRFSDRIIKAGYEHSIEIIRIPWTEEVNYPLLEKIIEFNIKDKVNCKTYWRS